MTTEQIADRIRFAYRARTPCTIRCGGKYQHIGRALLHDIAPPPHGVI
ncbi:hypothetical protein [Nocardia sp. NPDC005998]